MPGLKFIIDGDDQPLRRKLAALRDLAKKEGNLSRVEVYDQSLKNLDEQAIRRRKNIELIKAETAALQEKKAARMADAIEQLSPNKTKLSVAPNPDPVLENGSQAIDRLNQKMAELTATQARLKTQLDAGTITQAEYNTQMQANVPLQQEVARQIKHITDLWSKDTVTVSENTAATRSQNRTTAEQIGLLESLKRELLSLQSRRLSLIDPSQVAVVNAKIEDTQRRIRDLNRIGTAGFNGLNGAITKPIGTLGRLQYAANLYRGAIQSATNADIITKYNRKLQEVELQIARTSNMGREGFDSLGNAIGRSTNYLGRAWAGLRLIAQILPGIGIAGLLSFALGPIMEWVSALFKGTGALSEFAVKYGALNDVLKHSAEMAGTEIGNLKVLYATATDVNKSMRDRIAAAKEIKAEYPQAFSNSNIMAILNGREKDSYDQLTASIIENAKAKAAQDKINKIEAEKLEVETQIQKTNTYKNNQINRSIEWQAKRLMSIAKSYGKEITLEEARRRASIPTFDQIKYNRNASSLNPGALTTEASDPRGTNSEINRLTYEADKANTALYKKRTALNAAEALLLPYAQKVKKNTKEIEDVVKNFNIIIKNASSVEDLKNLQDSLQAKLNGLAPNDKQRSDLRSKLQQVQKIIATYSVKEDSSGDSAFQSLIESQNSLQEKIRNFTSKAFNKSVDPDQGAIIQIVDQFDALKFQINDTNAKYDAFVSKHGTKAIDAYNANPANKVKLSYVNPDTLKSAQEQAVANQDLLNENKYIEQDIEIKKKLYADYEEYKRKVGSRAADAEYAELLQSGKSFADYLDTLYKATEQLEKDYFGNNEGPISQRQDILKKEQTANLQAQKLAFQTLLQETITYYDKRRGIIEAAFDAEKQLNKKGQTDRAAQVSRETQERLTQLDMEQFQQMDAYRSFFENVDRLSTKAAKDQLGNLYAYAAAALATGNMTLDAYRKIIKGLEQAQNGLNNRLPAELKAAGSAMEQLAGMANHFDEELSKALSTVGNIVSGIGNIKGSMETLGSDTASSAEKISAGFAIVSTAIGVVTSVIGLFSQSKKKAEQAQYAAQLQLKAIEAVNKALERQLELTSKINGPQRISDYLRLIATARAEYDRLYNSMSGKIGLTGNKIIDENITKYNSGDDYNKILLSKKIIEQLTATLGLGGKQLEDYIKLLDQGLLDEKTAASVNAMRDLQRQIVDIQNTLNEELTGTSFKSLTDSVVQMFASWKGSTKDFADNFKKLMQDAVLNSFKRKYLEGQLQTFYDELYKRVNGAPNNILSAADIAELQKKYNQIIETAASNFENIQKATGIKFGEQADESALNKAIQGITSDQANALEGITRGQYDYIKKMYQVASEQHLTLVQQRDIAMQSLNRLASIDFNTGQTVVQLQQSHTQLQAAVAQLQAANASLTSIVKNTSGTSLRGNGLG